MQKFKPLVLAVFVLVVGWYALSGGSGTKKLLQSDDWQSVEPYYLVPGMKTADFSNRQWSRLPAGFVEWCEANRVSIVFLSNNEFTSTPSELVRFSSLKMLSMRMNKLKEVDCSALPKSLEHLVLTDNSISKFVGDCTFPRLKKLMLARNKLEHMDGVLMPKLELLRLSQNRFRTLPVGLLKHSYSLKWASFGDNPCCVCPPASRALKVVNDLDCSTSKQLGQGTSGVALLCNRDTLVVKQFKPLSSDGSAQSEIDVVSQLPQRHPNILAPVGVTATNKALVFPYVNAKALGKPPTFGTEDTFVVGEHRYSVQRVEDAVNQAACALRDIHRAQVSHGDLYAHNTVMSQSRFAFLDFGAGTCLGATSTQEERVLMYSLDSRAFAVLVQNMVDHAVNEDGVTTEYLETMGTKASLGVDAEVLCNVPIGRV